MGLQVRSAPSLVTKLLGANIFVFHVPINWTDDDFNAHFSPLAAQVDSPAFLPTDPRFGQIVSAKIHVDPVTKAG